MKKAKIKKRRNYYIVYANRESLAKCYSLEAAKLWRDVLGRSEKRCT